MPTEVMPKQALRTTNLDWTPADPGIVFPVNSSANIEFYQHFIRLELVNMDVQRIFYSKGVECDASGNFSNYLDPGDSVVIDDYIGPIAIQGEDTPVVAVGNPGLVARAEYLNLPSA